MTSSVWVIDPDVSVLDLQDRKTMKIDKIDTFIFDNQVRLSDFIYHAKVLIETQFVK